jgi:shikimate dehydrogenase
MVVNRTVARAEALVESFRDAGVIRAAGLDLAGDAPYDLVINATSAGTRGEGVVMPPGATSRQTCAYDMAYGAGARPFIERARAAGAQATADGLGMLVEQAAESFLLWRGLRPETAPVIAMLRGA